MWIQATEQSKQMTYMGTDEKKAEENNPYKTKTAYETEQIVCTFWI